MAEAVGPDGRWSETDLLTRQYLRGSSDGLVEEITANRAQRPILDRFERRILNPYLNRCLSTMARSTGREARRY
jgi:hypothetical protein